MESDIGFQVALEEARKGASEGGVPVGAALVSADGKILGRGHNMRIQKGSATLHVCENYLLNILNIHRTNGNHRVRLRLWRMPDACLPRYTRAQPCTQPSHHAICVQVLVYCTGLSV